MLDVAKFKDDYQRICEEVELTEVLISGGEPMLYWSKIKECLQFIKQGVVVHTMGVNLNQIDEKVHVSLSRHHWDHAVNEEILGHRLPIGYLHDYPYRPYLNLACNIIKGYVDNPADMRRVLDLAVEENVQFVGFVGLLPVNQFCLDRGMPPPVLEGDDIMAYRNFQYEDSCSCANFVYEKDGKVMPFYSRRCLCLGQGAAGRIVYKNGQIVPW